MGQLHKQPYIYDPNTHASGTRVFVERFIKDYFSLAERLEGSPQTAEPLYLSKPRDELKRYVGRAAKVPSSINPFESLWCMRVDIASAAKQLFPDERIALGCIAMGYTEVDIARKLDISQRDAVSLIKHGFDRLAHILDGTYDSR